VGADFLAASLTVLSAALRKDRHNRVG
jgi:hypothetical protein